jgi:EF-P beta-lysylation protein EpmB
MLTWQEVKRKNFTHWKDLILFLEWDDSLYAEVLQKSKFPLNIPLRLAEKIAKNTLNDPILKQFLPVQLEEVNAQNFSFDPLKEQEVRKGKKLLCKYQGRALLVTTGVCAMNCRFCFRRHFDYESTEKGFDEELKTIEADPTISEVLLSGGDPLSLSNTVLEALFEKLAQIPHVKRIRFHTRFPIGIPERIDTHFLKILENTRLQIIFSLHCNHPSELDDTVFAALKKIQRLGVLLLNQTVLLKDVNDDVETLYQLSLKLIDQGIMPYYLHQLDKVQGAAHFDVDEQKGVLLIEELRKRLPGYAVPKYVKEIGGEPAKTPIN